ncbi:MAG TPA: primosomal protein N' [Xanthomonadales bacterium]|nr:primosomal protein N' [Xanthomonadales bacterium]
MNSRISQCVARVALPVPLPQLFDYVQNPDQPPVVVGARVLVPFGRRRLVGIVVETDVVSEMAPERLLTILSLLDEGRALLDKSLMKLLAWCWQYYQHAPGEVLQTALPPALRKPDGSLPAAPVGFSLTEAGRLRLRQGPGRAKVQFALLQRLQEAPVSELTLASEGLPWRATMRRLLDAGWAAAGPMAVAPPGIRPGPVLTAEQQQAVDDCLAAGDRFQCHLLDGVTGSGKTEIYLQLLERVLSQGRQGMVLVPEIGLTPQLLRRFRQRLGLEPAVIHSRISAGERLQAWEAARSGRSRLLIGTRSALFTPMPELGLIILDEEHDASFKQQEGFRYSARDVAVKRASDLDVPIVLGSATPSLESINNAVAGRYQWHRLRERATQAALPRWRVLDLGQNRCQHGLAAAATEAIAETLARQEQVIVFLNRRGWAPVLMCEQCGWHGTCERCDANLTWHRGAGILCCHHCGSQRRTPVLCPDCRADALSSAGEGTQQLERALQDRFPAVPVLRFDRDSTSRKGSFNDQVEQVIQGGPCVLVGTQMLAKGHHFPDVTLVVVVNVDQSLYSADFRAMERLGQTLLQVSGRAGRAGKPGTVILQTFHPENGMLALLINQGYEVFARHLLEERRQTHLPPVSFQALLRAEAHSRDDVEQFLHAAAACFPAGESSVFGPMPAIMEKVSGRYRMYLMIQGDARPELHRQIDAWMGPLRSLPARRKVRWALDIDPQEL